MTKKNQPSKPLEYYFALMEISYHFVYEYEIT